LSRSSSTFASLRCSADIHVAGTFEEYMCRGASRIRRNRSNRDLGAWGAVSGFVTCSVKRAQGTFTTLALKPIASKFAFIRSASRSRAGTSAIQESSSG